MLAIIWRGFMSSKYGQLYLLAILLNAIVGGLNSLFVELNASTDIITFIIYLVAILAAYTTARYAYYLNCNIIIIIGLVFLLFIPFGVWLNLLYLIYKTFTNGKEDNIGTFKEIGTKKMEDHN